MNPFSEISLSEILVVGWETRHAKIGHARLEISSYFYGAVGKTETRFAPNKMTYALETLASVWVRSAWFEVVAIGDLTRHIRERQTTNHTRRAGYDSTKYELLVAASF